MGTYPIKSKLVGFISLLLIFSMLFLCACNNNGDSSDVTTDATDGAEETTANTTTTSDTEPKPEPDPEPEDEKLNQGGTLSGGTDMNTHPIG